MQRTCAVYNCRANLYEKVNGKYVREGYKTVFAFPFVPESIGDIINQLTFDPLDSDSVKDNKNLTKLWVNAMPNEKSSLMIRKTNGICIDHFAENDYYKDKRGRYFLKKGSVPSLFEGKILLNKPIKRTSLIEKEDELIAKVCKISAQLFDKEIEKSKIDEFPK